jgi:hemin uptake protein HemP
MPSNAINLTSEEPRRTFTTRTITSVELLQGENAILIQHNGGEYRLQMTRSKKLILTK